MPQILAVAGSLFLSEDSFTLSLENLVYVGGQFPFRDYRVLCLEGTDAQTFLHNQTTNNVAALGEGRFHLNAVLDISAKITAFFYVLNENNKRFYLLVHTEMHDALLERLDKYLIAEDVEVSESESGLNMIIGTQACKRFSEGFKGDFAGEEVTLTFNSPELQEVDDKELERLLILSGHPVWKKTIHELELFNNTRLADLAFDREKGCFLGQETVAKIESRRGAAYKPVALMGTDLGEIGRALKVKEKKVGKLLAGQDTINLASLNRESRIDGLTLSIDGEKSEHTVRYLPVWSKNKKAYDFYHHGVELFTKGEENEAELYLLKAIDCDAVYEEAYESLGVLYGRQERFEEAIEYMQKLSELNPNSVMAHTNMSLYYMRVGEIDKAEEQKSQATVKQFQQLGTEAEAKRKNEEAQKRKKEELSKREGMFREVLEIDPEDSLANYGLGEIEREKGNHSEAIKLLKNAIGSKKNYSVAWLALAKTYLAAGKKDEANDTIREGITIASKNGDLMPANEMQRLLNDL